MRAHDVQGNIGSWSVKVGDHIAPGDILCSIETDKATVDFEMQEEGIVAAILYDEGTKDIPLGTPLAILVEDEDDLAAFKDYKADDAGAAAAAPAAEKAPEAAPTVTEKAVPAPAKQAPSKPAGGRIFASPLAQNLANQQGVNLGSIAGTGPGGRIIKADVLEAPSGSTATSGAMPVFAAEGGQYVDLENSQIRKVIAERLTYSKTSIPHYYVTT